MQLVSEIIQSFPHFCFFETFHPLIVHIPVTLIPFSLFLYILSIFFKNNHFKIITNISLITGLLGAIVSTFLVHPHNLFLTEKAEKILNIHDKFAYLTLCFTLVSCIFLIIESNLFRFIKMKITYIIPLILIALSSLTVVITGHYGASLTHVHNIEYKNNDHC